MSRTPRRAFAFTAAVVLTSGLAAMPASADHTNPADPQSPIVPGSGVGARTTAPAGGSWNYIRGFSGATGTDIEFFNKGGSTYVSAGSLGQQDVAVIGQRILRLTDPDGTVNPQFVADHGSGNCVSTNTTSTTSLQHDAQVTPNLSPFLSNTQPEAELVIDTVDTTGRCHDSSGGGLEFVDVSGIGTAGSEPPREIHLTRHNGTSHTVTVDATRPWILYNNAAEFGASNTVGENGEPQFNTDNPAWIEVLDIRTCLTAPNGTMASGLTQAQKRAACRPLVYRIPFQLSWSAQELPNNTKRQSSSCHDITARPGKLYCAALNATLVLDVSGLTNADGSVKGRPLPVVPATDPPSIIGCRVVPAQGGSGTGAMVTDCALGGQTAPAGGVNGYVTAYNSIGRPAAEGWEFLGTVNHPGRLDQAGGTTTNTNTVIQSDEGVAVSHEADPTPDGRYMFVTDERGGGVVPPGATCATSINNPVGNGGIHVFDLQQRETEETNSTTPGNFKYARTAAGDKAVFISSNNTPAPTFCTVHVIEQIPDEQRIVAAYYTQGVKMVDYFIDANGAWSFRETASYQLPGANTWASEIFKVTNNPNGSRTYFFVANDIGRGIDVFSYTGPANPLGAQDPGGADPVIPEVPVAILLPALAAALLGGAVAVRRRRGAGALAA